LTSDNENSTPTSLAEYFKKTDHRDLSPSQIRSLLEFECKEIATQLREGLIRVIKSGLDFRYPTAVALGLKDDRMVASVLPFINTGIPNIVAGIKKLGESMDLYAYVLALDGQAVMNPNGATFSIGLKEQPFERNSVISIWNTSWGSSESTAIRYNKTTNPISFDLPIMIKRDSGCYDEIFPPPERYQ
jgi:hypothetical protein